jgi:citrate/tricarballylate utilization protein
MPSINPEDALTVVTPKKRLDAMIDDARNQMTICNACRYCEGYCAVFPAMELKRSFEDGDLLYMANLCFECRACYYACPYTPPHEYAINLPQVFSQIRVETYQQYTGAALLWRLFFGDKLRLAATGALLIGLFFVLTLGYTGSEDLFGMHRGEGAFYEVIPYYAMLIPALALSALWLVSLASGGLRFWRAVEGDIGSLFDFGAFIKATKDAAGLNYLRGGGDGCDYPDEHKSMARRWYHQALVAGVMLDLASTTLAAISDHFLDSAAPYAFLSPVVLLGTVGGILVVAGAAGLLSLKMRADRDPSEPSMLSMDHAFLALLLATSITGLLLLALRETGAMGSLLAVHLAIVALLFLTLPYGKFAHVVYRYAALIKNARDQRDAEPQPAGH